MFHIGVDGLAVIADDRVGLWDDSLLSLTHRFPLGHRATPHRRNSMQ
jgi:hypothetical protein